MRDHRLMSLTLAAFLALPPLQAARPEVVAGTRLDERPVRWVHTSEIYGISPLLKGGEVLMTTGLGLVGTGATAIGSYVESLAAQGVTALVLELGRTFTAAPPELVAAAEQHDLPLVLLHGVVPFIEITETVHPLLISGEIDLLRRLDRATTALHDAVAGGASGSALTALVGELCRGAVGLYSDDGALLLGDDVRRDGPARCEVEVGRTAWATLAVASRDGAPAGEVDVRLAELCARVLDLRLGPVGWAGRRAGGGADLVTALASGQYLASSDIIIRARAAGLTPPTGTRVVGLAVDLRLPGAARAGLTATTEAARSVFGPALVGEVEGELVIATTVPPQALRDRLEELADVLERELRATVGLGGLRIAAGPLMADTAGLARSLPAAREALGVARRLTPGSRTVLASDLAVYHLLSSIVDDGQLQRFVEDQLGPLLDQDARHGTDLVRTLDAYLEAGLSKTVAAEALGIRRQTLYARLTRIAHLLGGTNFENRQVRTALDLALVGWRLRSSAMTRRS